MNYFELYPGDYLRDTTRLSLVEHGAYLKLLMTYYAEEEPLPADENELFTIASATTELDKGSVLKVANRFFPIGDDGMRHNGRADEEIAKARKRIDASKVNGNKGGRPSKKKTETQKKPTGLFLGSEKGGFQEPKHNPAETQPGEALHTPHATFQEDGVSAGEDELPRIGPIPAVQVCLACRDMGLVRFSASHADLAQAFVEGVAVAAIVDAIAQAHRLKKHDPFTYGITAARNAHAAGPSELQGMNHGNSTRSGDGRESLADEALRQLRDIPGAGLA